MATKRAKKTDVVSPSSAELRKAVEAIAIQPKSGKITLLTRKLFNVLLAVAQQADESGDTYRALLGYCGQLGVRFERHRARQGTPETDGVGAG